MKKTLVALAVTAFAASSAQAVTVYNENGSKVEVDGSLRLLLAQEGNKTQKADGTRTAKKNSHTNLKNASSRFGVRVKHDLGEDFYALGRLEVRFKDTGTDNFGDLYAKRAYVGLGSKKLGEVTFGRQLTIADDYGQTDDMYYGFVPSYITTAGNSVIRYDYKGIEGLQIGANYNFAEKRDASGEVLADEVKNAYGLGAVYETQLANGHTLNVEGGIGRSNYATGTAQKHLVDGYELAVGYTIGDLKLVSDFGYKFEKDGADKSRAFFVAPGFQYQVTPKSRIYANYLYEREHGDFTSGDVEGGTTYSFSATSGQTSKTVASETYNKARTDGILLGTDYKLHKQVIVYVEGKYARTKYSVKNTQGYDYQKRVTDKAVGVGMRVYW